MSRNMVTQIETGSSPFLWIQQQQQQTTTAESQNGKKKILWRALTAIIGYGFIWHQSTHTQTQIEHKKYQL